MLRCRSSPNGVPVTTMFVTISICAGAWAPCCSTSCSTIANHSSDRNGCFANQGLPGVVEPDRRLRGVTSRITRADVEHVARLARLALSDVEIERLTTELGVTLEHVNDIDALDLDGVEPTAHPLPLSNVVRPDEVTPTLDRAEVLAQAPAAQDGRFRVPRILDAP